MTMQDSVQIRRFDYESGENRETIFCGVNCVIRQGISTDAVGFRSDSQIIVRIPCHRAPDIQCGDQIAQLGSSLWFTVTEVRDHCKPKSGLSHYKVVGRR